MKSSKIILVTIDTLRADHLGCYGYGLNTSPNLDRLAGESTIFTRAFTPCTYTVPTHAAILTGKYPGNISTFFREGEDVIETDRDIMLQEVLSANGFETAAFLSSIVLRKQLGLNAGFKVYDDETIVPEANRPKSLYRHGEDTNERLFRWLGDNAANKFFAWVHYFDVHGPYETDSPYGHFFKPEDYGSVPVPLQIVAEGEREGIPKYQVLGAKKDEYGNIKEYENDARYYMAGYDRGIRHVDDVVGQLVDELKKIGIYDQSLVIIFSDHGEALGENGVYFFHGLTVTPEQTRVPLFLKLPNGKDGGTKIERPVSTIDIMPTVLSFSGIDASALAMDGEDLLEPATNAGRFILCENEWQRAIIAGESCFINEKKTIRDGFTYYFDSQELCTGNRHFKLGNNGRGFEEQPDIPSAALLDFADFMNKYSDPKEITIRRKDSELLKMAELERDSGEMMEQVVLMQTMLSEKDNQIKSLREQLSNMEDYLLRMDKEREAIFKSFSWRITAPLKWLIGKLKG